MKNYTLESPSTRDQDFDLTVLFDQIQSLEKILIDFKEFLKKENVLSKVNSIVSNLR